MAEMQDMFDLNTAIDQLKNVLDKPWTFEVNSKELKTDIHVFTQTGNYSELVQRSFTIFNNAVKSELRKMIDYLIEERDKMTLNILQQHPVDTNECVAENKTWIHEKCNTNTPPTNVPEEPTSDIEREDYTERYNGTEGTDFGIL